MCIRETAETQSTAGVHTYVAFFPVLPFRSCNKCVPRVIVLFDGRLIYVYFYLPAWARRFAAHANSCLALCRRPRETATYTRSRSAT